MSASVRFARSAGIRRQAPALLSGAFVVLSMLPGLASAGQDVNTGLTGFEPHTAVVNPRNPAEVAVMQGCTVLISNDFGQTYPITRNTTLGCNGDPSLAWDSQGRLFISHLDTQGADGELTVVAGQIPDTTTAGAGTYTPVVVSADDGNDDDKEWLVADANPASLGRDNLYIVWTRFTGIPGAGLTSILFSRSTNQGATWSAPALMSGPQHHFAWPSHAAVGPNGDVYVAFHAQTCAGAGGGFVVVRRDDPGGAEFAAGRFGATIHAFTDGQAQITCNDQDGSGDEIPNTDFWMQGAMQPWVLPDPARAGNVYVVANDDPTNRYAFGDDGDVVIARSTDLGETWTVGRVDHGPGESFAVFPTAHIDQDGNIAVQWYDNRRRLLNTGANGNGGANFLLDVYATTSRDGGLNFADDVRVSDAPFDPDVGSPCRFGSRAAGTCAERIGEYNGMWSVNGIGYLDWTGNATPPAAPFPADGAGGQVTYFDLFSMLGLFPDALEPNESRDLGVATDLGTVDSAAFDGLTIHTATDEDFFRFVPVHTGSASVQIKLVGAVADLDLQVQDRFGGVIATASALLDTGSLHTIGLPVVGGQPYFVRVFGQGNQSAPQNTYDLAITNTRAPVPFAVNLVSASDSGRSDTDNVTNVTTPTIRVRLDESSLTADGLSFSATPDSNLADDAPGFKVELLNNGVSIGFASQVSPGVYQLVLGPAALSEGSNSLTGRVVIVDPANDPATAATDHAVGRGAQSDPLEVILDTTAPAAPSAPDLLASSDSGASDSDNVTRVNPPAFQGTGEVNALVRVRADGVVVGQGVIGTDATDGVAGNGQGAWEITVEPLNDGTYTVTAEAEDLAGNVSAQSAAMSPDLVIDTLAGSGQPQRPTLDLVNAFDTGRSDLDNVTGLSTVDVRVSAEEGSTVKIKDGNTVIDTFVMPPGGFTTRTLMLADGPHPLSAESEDAAGNRSHQSEELLITVDTIAPAPPSEPDLQATSDDAGVSIDDITTIITPAFDGSAEPNALVRIFAGGLLEGQGVATTGGAYEITIEPLDDGVYLITAEAEDLAGNVSLLSTALRVTIAHNSLMLAGAASPVTVDLAVPTVIGYAGVPGGVAGIRGIPLVHLDATGMPLTVLGTPANETLTFTPDGPASGFLTRVDSSQVLRLSGMGATFTIDPGGGSDTVESVGTIENEMITALVQAPVSTVQVGSLKTLTLVSGSTEIIGINANDGTDTVDVTSFDGLSARLLVDGDFPASKKHFSDVLNVRHGPAPRNQFKMRNVAGRDPGMGSAFVTWDSGHVTRIDYGAIEQVKLLR